MIEDKRKNNQEPEYGFVIFKDTFLSGWGPAPKGSYYCLAVDSKEEADIVLVNGRARGDMIGGQIIKAIPDDVPGVHIAIVDRDEADTWYEPGGFRRG